MRDKAIGVDLGGTYIKAGIWHRNGNLAARDQVPTLAEKGEKRIVLKQIEKIIDNLLDAAGGHVEGIGIGTPGLVDDRGVVCSAPNLPQWENLPLQSILNERYGLPVKVENDANATAWGEFLYGAGRDSNTMICITLGTGLGGGVVKDGKLLRGSRYSAFELGHITIDYKGPRCKCGNHGCIERFVGRDWIVARALKAIEGGEKTIIKDLADNKNGEITPETISEAYMHGDRLAETIWTETGAYLGTFFAGMVNIFNPDLIVIGGGVSQAGEILFSSVKKTIKERAIKRLFDELKDVVPAKLGLDAGIISSAALVFQK